MFGYLVMSHSVTHDRDPVNSSQPVGDLYRSFGTSF